MTLYARSDIQGYTNPNCPQREHKAAKGKRFVLECAVCEPIAARQKALFSLKEKDVPKTEDELEAEKVLEAEKEREAIARARAREEFLVEKVDKPASRTRTRS